MHRYQMAGAMIDSTSNPRESALVHHMIRGMMDGTKLSSALLPLSKYHPVFIEGMGKSDTRDPEKVAKHIHEQLVKHWESKSAATNNNSKPKIIVTQGDPLQENGISAITPRVAELLGGLPRCLIVLDKEIDNYHSDNADRTNNVILEFQYSQMTSVLEPTTLTELEKRIDNLLALKNQKRAQQFDKPPVANYFRQFALLQEVTKAACNVICNGDITVAHTAKEVNEFSVTSFYTTGLEMGLVQQDQMVSYLLDDDT